MRSTETRSIAGHLTAANLFGYQPEKQLQEPTTKPMQADDTVMAIYPAIKDQVFAQTMANYRKYISEYNIRTTVENELIDKHNTAVRIYKKQNQLSANQLNYIEFFTKRNKKLFAREYNTEVDEAGELLSVFLLKKRIQTVKYQTEQIFQNILHVYNSQLRKRNVEYMRLKVRTPRPVQDLVINSYLITQLERENILSLDICSKTVRNHRERLQEAGVFVGYSFHGNKKGVTVQINAEILVVLDLETSKIATTENQRVTSDLEKVLPDNNETTRAIKDDYKKSDDALQSSCDKVLPTATDSFHYKNILYKNTGGKLENFTGGAAPENVKVGKTLSENLRDLIIHPQELAVNLTKGVYDNYIPIDIRLLFKEAYGGTLTREEYRELVIQDHFKASAKLYRNSTAYAGSWKNAINTWMQNQFVTFNGFHFNKANVYGDVQQLRWRLEYARKWFARTNVTILYPSNYFDMTRKKAKEVGFEYTSKAWDRHAKYIKDLPAKKRKLERNAENRLKQINHSKKYENEIRRFLKGKTDISQLIDYVQNNLPEEFYAALPKKLELLQATLKL